MLSTTSARKRPAASAPRTAPRKPRGGSVPAHAEALARLGDAVALIDSDTRQLSWASEAWRALLPELADSCDVAALEPHLAGLGAALDVGGDAPRRLELGDSAEHLTDQHRGRRVLCEEVGCRRRDECNAKVFEEVVPGQLHSEVASEAVGALDDDSADAVPSNAVEHGLKPSA